MCIFIYTSIYIDIQTLNFVGLPEHFQQSACMAWGIASAYKNYMSGYMYFGGRLMQQLQNSNKRATVNNCQFISEYITLIIFSWNKHTH